MLKDNLDSILRELPPEVKLVAVSKFHPIEALKEAYDADQRCFGENRPQEFEMKVRAMQETYGIAREDIEWHFIGHLQTNKLKIVLPYADLVQSVDSTHLLTAINEWGKVNHKVINVLLELHIGAEETKQGFVEEEILDILFDYQKYTNVRFCGLMGMATHTDCEEDILADFTRIRMFRDYLWDLFPEITSFTELSIGMSSDWKLALGQGATIIRVGTAIFGARQY